jgi:A/G-specific adenine glycosylase
MAFAFDLPAPVVDTNVRSVLISELWLSEDISASDLEEVALACVPEWRSNDWHNALMDYGSLVATAAKTGVKPLGRQSKFEWSRRQLRGRVLKYLLAHQTADYRVIESLSEREDYKDIMAEMVQEDLVLQQWDVFSLK